LGVSRGGGPVGPQMAATRLAGTVGGVTNHTRDFGLR